MHLRPLTALTALCLRALGRHEAASPWNSGELIRAELYSVERLEQHAANLAAAQRIATRPPVRRSLAGRLRANERILLDAYRSIAAAVSGGLPITPAAEWLLDNYHLVEEQIREIRQDLPPSFYRALPKLEDGPWRGYPRVFAVAWAFVAHTDSRFDPDSLRRFLAAYQGIALLTIGELWAIAITLRIVLIENLRRAACSIVLNRDTRQEADAVADRLLGVGARATFEPDALLRRAAGGGEFSAAFIVQLVKRLRDQDPKVTPALQWLEQRVTAQGSTFEELVRSEHQKQGASNVTVRNIFTSMRLLSDLDWAKFFESVSRVDATLREYAGFAAMDFPTRNLYRGAIEGLARGCSQNEVAVAAAALAASRDAAPESRAADPGFHLIYEGRRRFEEELGYRAPLSSLPRRLALRGGLHVYVGAIACIAVVLLCVPLVVIGREDIGWLPFLALGLAGSIPAWDAAVALVNRGAARFFGATLLPGMSLEDGIPPGFRTLVVVPALFTSAPAIDAQIGHLEVHFLASPDGELYFALLSDWCDSATQSLETDLPLLERATAAIARLNQCHGTPARPEPFLLLHRRRVWSEGQRYWMGWERKRGKLHEVNRLLRGATDTTFVALDGQTRIPAAVRLVITLDADTRLPRDSVHRLIGKMAHPLNRPVFDAASGQVLRGYAVLQPRVAPSLPVGTEGSRFQRIFASAGGIDPYAAAASDVYQDLFGEGSYAGKGIYDVDAFQAALGGRVLDGELLSHDLFEGVFARAGLVSDIQVVEEFPARYDVAAARQHRWARGDWQLLPWMFGRQHARTGHAGGQVSLLGLWKMLDNLRRTLSAPFAFTALTLGWMLPRHAAWCWTAFMVGLIAVPAALPMFAAVLPRRPGISRRSHWYALRCDVALGLGQIGFLIAFLAHQAWLMTDAVARTLFRLFVIRRNLLQWVTTAQTSLRSRLEFWGACRNMGGGLFLAGVAAAAVGASGGRTLWPAAPFIVLWLSAPALAVWLSRSPRVGGRVPVSGADALELRRIARRTWRYFETFVTAEHNMLPPDNFQEDPHPVVAQRTSPTNIGLYLLATASAHDFGWSGCVESVVRLEATLETLCKLERHRGHFFNWYDTRDRRPLDPRYVSTVDSGNLAAHLLAAANACRGWAPLAAPLSLAVSGIEDALALAGEAIELLAEDRRTHAVLRHEVRAAAAAFQSELASADPGRMESAAAVLVDLAHTLAVELGADAGAEVVFWATAARRSLQSWQRDAELEEDARQALRERLTALASAFRSLALEMEFGFLLDPQRRLLSIGYRTEEGTLDENCYDLLASEARLASFVAIAKNDVPAKLWFRLGRGVTLIGRGAALISWSGSMFEYLMPSLVLRAPEGSLLDQTNRLIVGRQTSYGKELGIPWGMSESAYNARDLEMTYQYSSFGVPGLGFKRGLSQNRVVAPYASALAAMVDPGAAARNLLQLRALGATGRYGYYEAVDFTRSRVPDGAKQAVVKAYMAHHQGMTVAAIANLLFDGRMRDRFHAEPIVQANELLLQERTPRDVSVTHARAEEITSGTRIYESKAGDVRRYDSPHESLAPVLLLSNGRYAVMVTAAGSGYSRFGDIAVTRWREDATRDDMGTYVFLRDVEDGAVWSAGYQPAGVEPKHYDVAFTEDRAEFCRVDGDITTRLQVMVSPEDDIEVRRVSVSNGGHRDRDFDVTSYAEIALATPAADAAHPAFSKMFVQTEYVGRIGALLATRRRRSSGEPELWAAHQAVVEGETLRAPEYDTDRARFLGRGRELRDAIAVCDGRPLSNSAGTVLDPIFSLRHRLRVPAGATVRIAYWTGVAATRQGVLDLLDKHHDASAFVRAGMLAWTQAQVQLRHLGIGAAEAILFQRLAAHVLMANPSMRATSDTIRRGGGLQSALWAQGISGDLPIVLLRIDDVDEIEIVRQLLRAHEYWRMKLVGADLVILNERDSSYVQDLQNALETQVRMSQSRPRLGASVSRGSVFVLRRDLISEETRGVLAAAARVVLRGQRGSLAEQLDRHRDPLRPLRPVRHRSRSAPAPSETARAAPPPVLEFFNGIGGFDNEGREYVTLLGPGQCTPAPWINVIANPRFGFQVSAEGSGYTWSRNSRENQLTPWSNDPVSDPCGEALYVRDEVSGEYWGATAQPCRDENGLYKARHGQGWSRFEYAARGIGLKLVQFVAPEDPVKISRLLLHNTSDRTRHVSVTSYAEWVLGQARSASAAFVDTELDTVSGALLARNPWSAGAAGHVVFSDMRGAQTSWTGDRTEFLGRNGTPVNPAALAGTEPLSGHTGAGMDPCAALRVTLVLEPGESREVVWLLGEAPGLDAARALLTRYRDANLEMVLQAVRALWDDILNGVQIKTPDRALDIMVNRWLLYQTVACRLWARSAFYQASGAYGFRDQLQDSMAVARCRPVLAREQLLRAAGRQFLEGDVQHWWLPHSGQGVRTRVSDDRVWLAYVAAHYVLVSGDHGVLDETVPFLDGQLLRPEEHDAYFLPVTSDEQASLFEHCARALDHSLASGEHGLPLIGTGDWNDGFNCVGAAGKGESVWLGWFLYATLVEFIPFAAARGGAQRAAEWRAHATALQGALERSGWDGSWYRRAYYDDGTPLGSAMNAECRIDSIAQSWAVLSGAADPARAVQAMAAVGRELVLPEAGLCLLFTPPFDHTPLDPGYVKGYPPGIRENGGQYTHAAMWSVMAYAKLGLGDEAGALLALLNPINHAATGADMQRYKVEPYVVAADVYSVPPHVGRGGWTWYTGTAGWMYRAALESLVGLRVQGTEALLLPCIPALWPSVDIVLRHGSARYEICIDNPQRVSRGVVAASLDGAALAGATVAFPLVDDGRVHRVRVLLGTPREPGAAAPAAPLPKHSSVP